MSPVDNNGCKSCISFEITLLNFFVIGLIVFVLFGCIQVFHCGSIVFVHNGDKTGFSSGPQCVEVAGAIPEA